jgi:hypothetical protein
MSKASTLHEYARIGATARLTELKAEIAEIHRMFPGLDGPPPARRRPGRPKAQPAAPTASAASAPEAQTAPPNQVKPKRRKMSAAARKAIGDAQRKRWAKVKAAKK